MRSNSDIDWKSDWLYQLVFQELKDRWLKVRPKEFFVTQLDEVGENMSKGKPVHFWQFKGDNFVEIKEDEVKEDENGTYFHRFQYAKGYFAISPDRKNVAVDTVSCPLHDWGGVYSVKGAGDKAKLMHKPGLSGGLSKND